MAWHWTSLSFPILQSYEKKTVIKLVHWFLFSLNLVVAGLIVLCGSIEGGIEVV